MSFVHRQRRLYENPATPAFDFYRRPVNAIRAGRAAGRDQEAMAALLAQANERSRPHYAAISEGWLRYLGRRRPALMDVARARWNHAGMDVRVSPHLGLAEADGTLWAVFLYCKADPLPRDGANVALCLLEETMHEVLPGGNALVVDVRRAKPFTLGRRDRPRVGAWARSEAAAFMTLWEAAA
ncbi:hypothetical protein [Amycolatopsis anabasis]|uniref:hypothetical protein n=1 Tax=Amycolatopsis anabasis TaxID=1840409 RepID=UPI001FE8D6A8|nr:hypothetical protein [Amycolatopsis anabasis]